LNEILFYLFSYIEFKSKIFIINFLSQIISNRRIKVLPINDYLLAVVILNPKPVFFARLDAGLVKEYLFWISSTDMFSGINTFSRLISGVVVPDMILSFGNKLKLICYYEQLPWRMNLLMEDVRWN